MSRFPPDTIGFKTSPQNAEWPVLDETWAAAAELRAFSAGWMNDHLTDLSADGGPSFEALTLMAALAHRVPGVWVGHAVLSNTFRHPAALAKAATVLDHVTAGRFVLGLGAGWHEGEHRSLGIPLPPIRERIDRLESAVATVRALFSSAAAAPPGVTRDDRHYPLDAAVKTLRRRSLRVGPRCFSEAKDGAASRSRGVRAMAGSSPASTPGTTATSPASGTRCCAPWRPQDARRSP
jgi:alkanesulfonate monooxygenase SsuD/methylene tetrahydromethanopterin reductase-like flavin-dependent oxidoreductase (luciferase family)